MNTEVPKQRLSRAVYHQQMVVCVNRREKLDCSKERVQGAYTVVASCYTALTKLC